VIVADSMGVLDLSVSESLWLSQMSFDATAMPEARAGTMNSFDGRRMTASCVRWDEESARWTVAKITHVGVEWPDPAAVGAAASASVTCTVTTLGLFAVAEVPVDCAGTVRGLVARDLCGVCGGDNGTCSGCDGAPFSGRSKACGGHGRCEGPACVCDPGYYGAVCQVKSTPAFHPLAATLPILNCS
jgi:hypothetical protein